MCHISFVAIIITHLSHVFHVDWVERGEFMGDNLVELHCPLLGHKTTACHKWKCYTVYIFPDNHEENQICRKDLYVSVLAVLSGCRLPHCPMQL